VSDEPAPSLTVTINLTVDDELRVTGTETVMNAEGGVDEDLAASLLARTAFTYRVAVIQQRLAEEMPLLSTEIRDTLANAQAKVEVIDDIVHAATEGVRGITTSY